MVGPSGTGKTTLLNLVAGIVPPLAGTILVGGTPVHALPDGARRGFRARTIGFVFQEFGLLDYLSAFENILYPFRIGGLTLDADARVRARDLAAACGLAGEATGNLDPATKEAVLDLLFARAAEAGATILAVTHDHALLPRFDRSIDFQAFRGTGPAA